MEVERVSPVETQHAASTSGFVNLRFFVFLAVQSLIPPAPTSLPAKATSVARVSRGNGGGRILPCSPCPGARELAGALHRVCQFAGGVV